MFRKLYYFISYIILLLREVVVANFEVAKVVLSPKIKVDPLMIEFKTRLKTDFYRVILANSITLTPGTITISLENDVYTVHCLKKEFASGLENSKFENLLIKMEENEYE